LHLVDFVYNNGYHALLKMIPFEFLYGRRWNTQVIWDNPVNKIMLGLEIFKEIKQEVIKIKQNLNTSQERKKSYVDNNRMHEEFRVREHFYHEVRPWMSSLKLGTCAKIAPRYVGNLIR